MITVSIDLPSILNFLFASSVQ